MRRTRADALLEPKLFPQDCVLKHHLLLAVTNTKRISFRLPTYNLHVEKLAVECKCGLKIRLQTTLVMASPEAWRHHPPGKWHLGSSVQDRISTSSAQLAGALTQKAKGKPP
jgi:hypothetical protein